MTTTTKPSAMQTLWESWNAMNALGNSNDEMDVCNWAFENVDALFAHISKLEQQIVEKDELIKGYVESERQLILMLPNLLRVACELLALEAPEPSPIPE